MPCLEFVPGLCCPHYDEEPARRPATKKYLLKYKDREVIGIEVVALFILEIINFIEPLDF